MAKRHDIDWITGRCKRCGCPHDIAYDLNVPCIMVPRERKVG